MNLKEKVNQIEKLQAVHTPWEVKRIFGKIELFGNQICVITYDPGDYVSVEEMQKAIDWLVEQLDGKVKWNKKAQK